MTNNKFYTAECGEVQTRKSRTTGQSCLSNRQTTMGMDLLDITFCIEEKFEVSFSTDDLEPLVRDNDISVGDLYYDILKRLHMREVVRTDVRLNYAFWIQFQSEIHSATKIPIEQVKLQTPLVELFPRVTRQAAWEELFEASSYRIRRLEYPKIVRLLGFALAVTMVFAEQFQIWQIGIAKFLWPALGLLGIFLLLESYVRMLAILRRFQVSFPSGVRTVKDLCRVLLATNLDRVSGDTAIPLDERCIVVWEQLTAILVETLGVDADQVTLRSRLFRDLGAE